MKRVATWAAAVALLGARAKDDNNDQKDDEKEMESWRKMSVAGCISSDVASSGFIGYTVGEYWMGMDVDISADEGGEDGDGLGNYVNMTLIPYKQDGNHFILSEIDVEGEDQENMNNYNDLIPKSDLESIELCASLRDMYWDGIQNSPYNLSYTYLGWFMSVEVQEQQDQNQDGQGGNQYYCWLETLTQPDEDGEDLGGDLDTVDCNNMEDDRDRNQRRRLKGGNNQNEVEGCENGNFIRSNNVDPETPSDCSGQSSCEFADALTHDFSAGEPELLVLPLGSTLTFDLSGMDPGRAVVYEFGTLEGCNQCYLEEEDDNNNNNDRRRLNDQEQGRSFNRIVSNATETSIVLQQAGYRCFAAMVPGNVAGNQNTLACSTRVVVRVDPCYESVTTDIQLQDDNGSFRHEKGFYNLRNYLSDCIGYSNFTAIFNEETIYDVLDNLYYSSENVTGIKDMSVTVFQEEVARSYGADATEIEACLTNTTALTLAIGYEVQSAKKSTPSPTPEPEEPESNEEESSSKSNAFVYLGIGAAVLVVLAVAGYFFFNSCSSSKDGHQPLKGDGENAYGAA